MTQEEANKRMNKFRWSAMASRSMRPRSLSMRPKGANHKDVDSPNNAVWVTSTATIRAMCALIVAACYWKTGKGNHLVLPPKTMGGTKSTSLQKQYGQQIAHYPASPLLTRTLKVSRISALMATHRRGARETRRGLPS